MLFLHLLFKLSADRKTAFRQAEESGVKSIRDLRVVRACGQQHMQNQQNTRTQKTIKVCTGRLNEAISIDGRKLSNLQRDLNCSVGEAGISESFLDTISHFSRNLKLEMIKLGWIQLSSSQELEKNDMPSELQQTDQNNIHNLSKLTNVTEDFSSSTLHQSNQQQNYSNSQTIEYSVSIAQRILELISTCFPTLNSTFELLQQYISATAYSQNSKILKLYDNIKLQLEYEAQSQNQTTQDKQYELFMLFKKKEKQQLLKENYKHQALHIEITEILANYLYDKCKDTIILENKKRDKLFNNFQHLEKSTSKDAQGRMNNMIVVQRNSAEMAKNRYSFLFKKEEEKTNQLTLKLPQVQDNKKMSENQQKKINETNNKITNNATKRSFLIRNQHSSDETADNQTMNRKKREFEMSDLEDERNSSSTIKNDHSSEDIESQLDAWNDDGENGNEESHVDEESIALGLTSGEPKKVKKNKQFEGTNQNKSEQGNIAPHKNKRPKEVISSSSSNTRVIEVMNEKKRDKQIIGAILEESFEEKNKEIERDEKEKEERELETMLKTKGLSSQQDQLNSENNPASMNNGSRALTDHIWQLVEIIKQRFYLDKSNQDSANLDELTAYVKETFVIQIEELQERQLSSLKQKFTFQIEILQKKCKQLKKQFLQSQMIQQYLFSSKKHLYDYLTTIHNQTLTLRERVLQLSADKEALILELRDLQLGVKPNQNLYYKPPQNAETVASS